MPSQNREAIGCRDRLRLQLHELARRAVRLCFGTSVEADDLLQDTIERALAAGLFPPTDERALAMIHATMRNRFVDLIRSGRRRRALSTLLAFDAQSPMRVTRGLNDTLGVDLRRAVAAAPEADVRLFSAAIEGIPQEEIASELAVRPVTVATRLARARARLRTQLELEND